MDFLDLIDECKREESEGLCETEDEKQIYKYKLSIENFRKKML